MFPEYRDEIAKLRANDSHFASVFNKHNDLDDKVKQLESKYTPAIQVEIEKLKKEKLLLKEEIYTLIKKSLN